MSAPLLRADGLTVRCGGDVIVLNADFEIRPAEVLAITGPAGAGKSLLLRGAAGLMPRGYAADGEVARPGRLALVPQDADLTPHRTLAAQFAEVLGPDARPRAVTALERMEVSAAARRLDLYPHELPDGIRMRAVLALALATGPEVLLADAPGAGLDPTVRARLLGLLAAWAREAGAGLILAGRAADGVAGPADRVLRLDHGRLGPPAEAAEPPSPAARGEGGAPVLSVRDLHVAFPLGRTWRGGTRWLTVVEGVGFELPEGETVALLGETGSGKSMVARAILRLIPASSGRVAWHGRDLLTLDPPSLHHTRRDMQALFPDPRKALDPRISVGEQLAEAAGALIPEEDEATLRLRVADALARAGLPAATAEHYPAGLTPGEAARVGLARALVPHPRLLVCDEPTAMLDPADREALIEHLLHLQRQRGVSLVLATADAALAWRVGHRVLVLLAGQVVEEADAATLLADARHPYTRALIATGEGRMPDLRGDPPSALRLPSGCPLRLRCPRARDTCADVMPALETVRPGHRVACHYWDETTSNPDGS
ncbi:MAG TPA: oligopeptide/dipeptide ABC transporter ATP-binding protein [Azospirillum sp.]|nr:oligopeptide/dipeptide ABC transporter ATP-binding protein [Azospirillum sp.]